MPAPDGEGSQVTCVEVRHAVRDADGEVLLGQFIHNISKSPFPGEKNTSRDKGLSKKRLPGHSSGIVTTSLKRPIKIISLLKSFVQGGPL